MTEFINNLLFEHSSLGSAGDSMVLPVAESKWPNNRPSVCYVQCFPVGIFFRILAVQVLLMLA